MTTLAKTITDEIAVALSEASGATPHELYQLRQRVREEAADLTLQAEEADQGALDPLASDQRAEADVARAASLRRKAQRLSAAIDALRDRQERLEREAAEAHRKQAFNVAKVERDALAEELRERYPILANELADLLRRVTENNTTLSRMHGLPSAELVARGLRGHETASRLTAAVRLPPLSGADALAEKMLWPPPPPRFRGSY